MASSSDQQANRRPRILVAATGCVATVHLGVICFDLVKWADVQVVVTKCAKPFIDHRGLPPNLTVYTDASEFTTWKRLGDPVLHIELQKWADLMVIAPLSANTLAKIAAGICDNLLTSIVKTWNCAKKPLLFAPAMNTLMWNNALTEQHLHVLEDDMCMFHIRPLHVGNRPGPMAEASVICGTILTTWHDLNS